jgi:D-serine dehydratase
MSRGYDVEAVAGLSLRPVPPGTKGFAVAQRGPAPTGAGLAGASMFGAPLSFPVLTVRDSAVTHNIGVLSRFADASGVLLAPHAKTTMAPQLFARQLAAGSWGLTAATISQMVVYRQFGVARILLANELVDPDSIAWLAEELRSDPGFEAYCYVDSLEAVRLLDRVLTANPAGRRLNVLVELGYPGGRTGCRTVAGARTVAAAAAGTATLAVVGAAGYEGGLGHDRSAAVVTAVRDWCAELLGLLDQLADDGLLTGPGLVSAGGSAYPDVVAAAFGSRRAGVQAVIRSGSYITHDDGLYAELSPFTPVAGSPDVLQPALELWARVLSRPEPGLAILDLGRRDAGFDQALPNPRRVRSAAGSLRPATGLRVTQLNDQHAFVDVPPEFALEPGDLVGLGISHPCTTIDRWRHLVLVDDDDRVLDVLRTYF